MGSLRRKQKSYDVPLCNDVNGHWNYSMSNKMCKLLLCQVTHIQLVYSDIRDYIRKIQKKTQKGFRGILQDSLEVTVLHKIRISENQFEYSISYQM